MPYGKDALAPAISLETMEYHYGKHFQAYIDNLNKLIEGSPYEDMEIEEIVMKAGGAIFNNAAQAWNHDFYFQTLTPVRTEMPDLLKEKIEKAFGSVSDFKTEFIKAASTIFGSGWAWLCEKESFYKVVKELYRDRITPVLEGILKTDELGEWREKIAASVEMDGRRWEREYLEDRGTEPDYDMAYQNFYDFIIERKAFLDQEWCE